jgi:hypothetical protein
MTDKAKIPFRCPHCKKKIDSFQYQEEAEQCRTGCLYDDDTYEDDDSAMEATYNYYCPECGGLLITTYFRHGFVELCDDIMEEHKEKED